MKNSLRLALVAWAALVGGCATKMSSDKNAPTGPPSASIRFESGSAAYWASAAGGSGTLTFKGRDHGFKVRSVGAGGTGAQSISGTALVYNLNKLSDFPGSYTGVRSGLTLIKGKFHGRYTNDNDVVIYVEATTKGLATSMGAETVVITLK